MVSIALQKGNYRTNLFGLQACICFGFSHEKFDCIASHSLSTSASQVLRVWDMADDEWGKGSLLTTFPGNTEYHGSSHWEQEFRMECELAGPQSWRRFLHSCPCLWKRHGPYPTKEWKAYVDELLESLRVLSHEENMMLWAKHVAKLRGIKNVPRVWRHYANWEVDSFSQGD